MVDLEDIAKGIGVGTIALVGTSAVALLYGTAGSFMGALAGQICDVVPYVKHAIPEGIGYIAQYISDAETAKHATQALYGNLDKVGAALGFTGGFIRGAISFTKRE